MKYQSELIKEIVETRGHEKSSLHYESECIESWIEETKWAYPKLCDYQSEWLNYINENPIGEFPYETVTDVTEATVNNVVPYAYKSVILSGNTKYRDIDTGDILDTLDETKNLELVSVKMPVLTTTGKNLFQSLEWELGFINSATGAESNQNQYIRTKNYIDIQPNATYTATGYMEYFMFYDSDKNFISGTKGATSKKSITFTTPSNARYLKLRYFLSAIPTLEAMLNTENMLELGEQSTGKYEPYKSNILTVNEDVVLRGIGDVQDTLDLTTGELTERISTFKPTGAWSVSREMTNTILFNVKPPIDMDLSAFITCDNLPVVSPDGGGLWDTDIEGIGRVARGDLIRIRLAKTKASTLQEFVNYMQSNPITIQYQLATESIKTVDLSIQDQDGNTLRKIKPIEGTMHIHSDGTPLKPTITMEIPVEALTQNLASFIKEE